MRVHLPNSSQNINLQCLRHLGSFVLRHVLFLLDFLGKTNYKKKLFGCLSKKLVVLN